MGGGKKKKSHTRILDSIFLLHFITLIEALLNCAFEP